MSKRLTGLNPLSYLGVEPTMPVNTYQSPNAPTPNDVQNFNLGDFWVDTTTETLYVLVSQQRGVATWITTFGGAASKFVTNSGTATDSGGIINLLGDEVTTLTNASGNTINVTLTQGSNGQLLIGGNSVSAQWGSLTSDGTITFTTGVNSLEIAADKAAIIGNGTNGQLLIAGGTAPQWASLTSDGSIIITPGVNTLEITAPNATGLTTVHTNSGTATQAGGAITIEGDGVTTTTSGSGSTVTVDLVPGTDGQLIIGSSIGAPAWANLTSVGATVTITNGHNSINLESVGGGSGTTAFATDSGTANEVGGSITIAGGHNISTAGAGNTVTVNVSGTTDHAVQIGNATDSLSSIAVGTDGQVLIGATSADPAFATLTSTGGTITYTIGPNTLNLEAVGGGGGSGTIVTPFMTSDTWTKNTQTKYVMVYGWSAGGGGGSGSGNGLGGSGAGSGSFFRISGPSQFFGATEPVVVGAGGTGGTGVAGGVTQGNPGTNGGISSFGVVAPPLTTADAFSHNTGIQYGSGGNSGSAGGQSGGIYLIDAMAINVFSNLSGGFPVVPTYGIGGGYTTTVGNPGAHGGGDGGIYNYYQYFQGTPGGGGGSNASTPSAGGAGGNIYALNGSTVLATGGTAGATGVAGGNGNNFPNFPSPSVSSGLIWGGTGGGGGGSQNGGTSAKTGGTGGFPGGGGGGGGGCTSGTSGTGGAGGNGLVIVIEWT